MPTQAQIAANIANSKQSTGPRTEEGRAASSANAIKLGLFTARDFIRPGEESLYAELEASARAEFAPSGLLEESLVDEIRRAMWRLRRCGQIEAGFSSTFTDNDPMQNEATAKLQSSVDRARAQSHRILHRCTAELRRLQTERRSRIQCVGEDVDTFSFGLCDLEKVRKIRPLARRASSVAEQTQTARNVPGPCGSGQKYKCCCEPNDAPMPRAA